MVYISVETGMNQNVVPRPCLMESETQTDELEVDQPVPIDKTVESEFQDDQGLYERQLDDILLKLKIVKTVIDAKIYRESLHTDQGDDSDSEDELY